MQIHVFVKAAIHSIIVSLVVSSIYLKPVPEQATLTYLLGLRAQNTDETPVVTWLIEAPSRAGVHMAFWVLLMVAVHILIFVDGFMVFMVNLLGRGLNA